MTDFNIPIYLELHADHQQLLNENHLSIEEILHTNNIPVKTGYGVSPEQNDFEARSKELVMVIIASASMAFMIGHAIAKILHVLGRRPQLVEYYDLVEIRDGKVDLLLNKNGNPLLKRQKRYELIEPRKEDSRVSFEINANVAKGLVLKFGSTEEQMMSNKNIK